MADGVKYELDWMKWGIEIIDKEYNYSKVDGIFVELFKKAKLFEFCIEHFKRSREIKYNFWD